MRDVCPKCLHRVKPKHVRNTGQGYAQLWRCPECGEVTKMCRWLFKLPEERLENNLTPEQIEHRLEQRREVKRLWDAAHSAQVNARKRKRYAEDPEYREKCREYKREYYWRNREEILTKNAKYRKENADYLRYMRKRRKLMQCRDQEANEQKEQ